MRDVLQSVWSRLKVGVCFVVLGALALHLALTTLYVMPPNPIKTLTNIDAQYIGKYFYQDWGLFAPTPIDIDLGVLVECLTASGFASGPLDVTSDFIAQHQRNPFSPFDRVARVPGNYAHSFISLARSEESLAKLCQKDPNASGCDDFKQQQKNREAQAKKGLALVAQHFCADMSKYRFGKSFDRAHVWVTITNVPRWSKRADAKAPPKVVDAGLHKISTVAALGIWR